ncbi:NADH-quinone oxidoreductase subunit NuoH [Occultella gossypii]|uniref:NADH-quinone oxidoreductase subunit H n=1 Tax=Occultella gossypii TaxID=2800820 RepID=A0ABS7SD88_9MICO|nr:NADH-quinone oxidoreductase subunit NuoH [Occultella gossypii]MBZ2198027.1 NADH-quinone oxidoreductase subunit NuoH [Occultella gossypii]
MNTNLAPILARSTGAADFSNDTIWVSVLKAVAILLFLLLSVLFALWFERRIIARFQQRLGPNVRGPFGLVQSIPDALKLILKEDITVKAADKVIYVIAPVISVFCAFMIYAVIPFGPEVTIPFTDFVTPLQLTDLPVSILYILGITGLGVYGIVLGGWSSGSTYPLLGAVRSTAQIISYELGMSLALVSVLLVAGSMSTSEIVNSQENLWWAFALLPAFVVYLISAFGEVNRLPFDLPEAEGELVAGYQTEYSSMKFAWFYLAEYINMLNVAAVATTVFLGGWRAPWPLVTLFGEGVDQGWWGFLWFILKIWLFMFLFVWVRATLLRFRYDQFMAFGWKVLIPVALVWLGLVAAFQGVRHFTSFDPTAIDVGGLSLRTVLFGIAGILIIVTIVMYLIPDREAKPAVEGKAATGTAGTDTTTDEPFDAFAGGFPVPPLPGQKLPPSKRRARVTTPAAPAEDETTDEEKTDG